MDIISMNSKNSNILKRSEKYVALSTLSTCYTWSKRRNSYKNKKFKNSGGALAKEFEFRGRSYLVSDIQIYFIKNMNN